MDWNLIHKYLSGECSDVEKDMVKRWIREDPQHREFMDFIEKIWKVAPKDEITVDARAAWDQFKYRVIDKKADKGKPAFKYFPDYSSLRNKSSWYQKSVTYASVAVFLLLIALIFVMNEVEFGNKAPAEPTVQEIMSAKGERTNLKLGDGTKIMLNAESKLRIPSDYGEKNRTLYLTGEAFFEVEHDETRPFIVHSGDVYTEDLGTKFNIRAFPDDERVEVAVSEGKVKLGTKSIGRHDSDNSMELYPHQIGTVSDDGNITMHNAEDLIKYTGWTEGKFKFDDTTFEKLVAHLERWYNVECVVKDPALLNRHFTATFNNESLSYVLRLISASMDIQVKEEEGRTIVFESISDNQNR